MAIIGISGKLGSGKDLTGKIIQYLLLKKENKDSIWSKDAYFGDHPTAVQWLDTYSDWKIKKFAGKLKEIVSILTGISTKDLEKQEVKDMVLGEEWWYWCVFKTSQRVSYLENKNFDKTDLSVTLIKPNIRQILQELGTDLLRNQLHPNIWVNALMNEYKPREATLISKDCPRQDIYSLTEEDEIIYGTIGELYPNWIITDVRFPNEAKAVKDKNGILIRVNRFQVGDTVRWDENLGIQNNKTNYYRRICTIIKIISNEIVLLTDGYTEMEAFIHELELIKKDEHESETALDKYQDWDYVIENHGTIEDLIFRVKEILIEEKMI